MRALIVSLFLAVVVVICMAFVVVLAKLDLSSAVLLKTGLGIFAAGALFAVIAAFGPKSRPTPLLTPIIAGAIAAVFAAVIFIFATMQFGQASRSAMHTSAPAKVAPTMEAPARAFASPEPTPSAAENEPEPILFPGVSIVPARPSFASVPGPVDTDASTRVVAPAATQTADDPVPPTPPLPDVDTATDPASTNSLPEEQTAASTSSDVPVPPTRPPPGVWLELSKDRYDISRPPPLPPSATNPR